MHRFCLLVLALCLLAAMLPVANAQSVTGQLSGNVTDSSGAIVAGATVHLIDDLSQTDRSFHATNGSFIFTGLVPGTYTLKILMPGFKTYEQKRITVAAQERVDLHEIALQVGDVATTVEVLANGVHVATDSSDRSVDITLRQIEDTPTRGRNPP